jgi:hypothetical protein
MLLTNVDTQDTQAVQYNPTSWDYSLAAVFTRQDVVGMSHQPSHYHHTDCPKLSLELLLTGEDPTELGTLDFMGRWLESFLYPWRGKVRPPRMLLSWPGEAHLVCEVDKVAFGRRRFNEAARTVEMDVKLELTPVRDTRLYGDDVLRAGLKRGAS